MPFDTPITRILGILQLFVLQNHIRDSIPLGVKVPIIAAPMAGASGGLLAAQVTAGGGFGFLTAGLIAHLTEVW